MESRRGRGKGEVAAQRHRRRERGDAEDVKGGVRRGERGGVADEEGGEALALLVLGVLAAVDEARAPALHDVAVLAHSLDRRPHLHRVQRPYRGTGGESMSVAWRGGSRMSLCLSVPSLGRT